MFICLADGLLYFRQGRIQMGHILKNSIIYTVVLLSIFALGGCGSPPTTDSNAASNSNGASSDGYTTAEQAVEAGIYYLENDETQKAIDAFNKAIEMDPNQADAYFQLGITYALLEARDIADVRAPSEPAASSGNSADASKPNSQVNFEKAVEAYKARIAVNLDDAGSYFGLGRSLNKLNRDEEAKKALLAAVEKSPENVTYIIALGAILMKLAQYPAAIVQLKLALELDPDNPEALQRLEDAQAGRSRVNYSSSPKPSPSKTPVANANTANTNTQPPDANTAQKSPTPAKPPPTPAKPAANKP